MKNISLDFRTSRIKMVEHGIRPPMSQAITVPVLAKMEDDTARDVILYICSSGFSVRGRPSDQELKDIAEVIATRLAE